MLKSGITKRWILTTLLLITVILIGTAAIFTFSVREYYYDSKAEGRQKTDEEYYDDLCDLTADLAVECVVVDPSAASFLATLRAHKKFRVLPARNDVLPGIRRVHEAFRQHRLFISPACTAALREFSLYRWAENESKDTVLKVHDHAMDDIRYFVSTILSQQTQTPFIAIAVDRADGQNTHRKE